MTGGMLEPVTDLSEPAVYRCIKCGGCSRTRLPSHEPDCPEIAGES